MFTMPGAGCDKISGSLLYMYNALHCSGVQCSAVMCSAVQDCAVQCSAVWSSVQCTVTQCRAVQYNFAISAVLATL